MTTEARLAIAIQGLRDVVNPLLKMRRECPPGHQLNGIVMNSMADQSWTYREIALNTLQALGEPAVEPVAE